MIKRVFLAIEIPEETKRELAHTKSELKNLFGERVVKWVEDENLHITLLFLGSVREEKLEEMKEALCCVKTDPFSIRLTKVVYHPPFKEKAKLIWAKGESKMLPTLKKKVEEALQRDHEKDFKPHVTLGRIKRWEFRKMSALAVPEVNEDISLEFTVSSFNLLESRLKKEGPEYKLLKSFKLYE